MADSLVLSPLVETWLTTLDQQGKSRHTQAAYRRALAHFGQWAAQLYGTPWIPATTMPRDVRDWKAHQQQVEQAAPATINQRVVALSRFFAWAVREGELREDPTQAVSSLRLPTHAPKALDDRDLRRLLRAVHAGGRLRDIALLELLAGTGLRVGEVLALQVGDLQLGERSGMVTVRLSKGGGTRRVPLTVEVRHALTAYLATFPVPVAPTTPLWQGKRGPLLHRSSVLRLLEIYSRQAGIDAVGPHALRHTFATRYLAANPGDLRSLAALLGHANLETVMIYTAPRFDDLAERMQRMEH
ncbi:MAG TPA: tyrosine-type recombinase/integrase [Herpetosiphonaceae bacterium]|nr:tyrosine-type recombinase/integrase [Herpetosiphonaceae bacterium]